MKNIFRAIALLTALLLCYGAAADSLTTVPYFQFSSGGSKTEMDAVILYENSNSTFTKYQLAYTSCTCRGAQSNFRSVMYIELLNTKDSASDAAIRQISFSDVEGTTVGMWGDSNPIYMRPEYTFAYMDEHFVQTLVGSTKRDFDAWAGYGKHVPAVDVDAVAGATVSTSNIQSVIRGLFAYHAQKYYPDKP